MTTATAAMMTRAATVASDHQAIRGTGTSTPISRRRMNETTSTTGYSSRTGTYQPLCLIL